MKTRKLYSWFVGLLLLSMSGFALATSSIGNVWEGGGTTNTDLAKEYRDYFNANDSENLFDTDPVLFGVTGWDRVAKNEPFGTDDSFTTASDGTWGFDSAMWGDGSQSDIDAGKYTSFAVVLKASNEFVVWLLNSGVSSGDWAMLNGHAVSHIALYGTNADLPDGGGPPSSVPLPAAVWLFGSSMLGLIGFSRRKA